MGNSLEQHRAAVGSFACHLVCRGWTASPGPAPHDKRPPLEPDGTAILRNMWRLTYLFCAGVVLASGQVLGPTTAPQMAGHVFRAPMMSPSQPGTDLSPSCSHVTNTSYHFTSPGPTHPYNPSEYSNSSNPNLSEILLHRAGDVEPNPGPSPSPPPSPSHQDGLRDVSDGLLRAKVAGTADTDRPRLVKVTDTASQQVRGSPPTGAHFATFKKFYLYYF